MNLTAFEVDELNVLIAYLNYALVIIYCFIVFLIEMSTKFKQKLMNDYVNDSIYKYIFKNFDINSGENIAKLSFLREHKFIFRFDVIINNHVFTLKRLCVSNLYIKNIL